MPEKPLHPAYAETGPHRPQRGVLCEACAYVLLSTGVAVSVAGLLLLAGGWIFWTVLALLIALPRLAEIALGAALLISAVKVIPDTEGLAVLSALAQHWPVALAVLVPVPLAALIDRTFFRRRISP
jgi:hypothetical protein